MLDVVGKHFYQCICDCSFYQRICNTDNFQENEDSLYSTRTETAPQRQQPPSDVQYTSVNPGLPERTRETIVIPPGMCD